MPFGMVMRAAFSRLSDDSKLETWPRILHAPIFLFKTCRLRPDWQSEVLRQSAFEVLPRPLDVEHLYRMHLELILVEMDERTAQRNRFHLHPCVQLGIDRPQHRPWQRRANHGVAVAADQNDGIVLQSLRQRRAELGIVDHQLAAQAWIVL